MNYLITNTYVPATRKLLPDALGLSSKWVWHCVCVWGGGGGGGGGGGVTGGGV